MKKLKSFLVVAFLAIGFAASSQTINVNNTTGIMFQATFSNVGTPCPPSLIPIPPGFSGSVTVSCPSLLIPDRVEVVFDDFTCVPIRTNQHIVTLCNNPTVYTNCNSQTIIVYYDCVNQQVQIF